MTDSAAFPAARSGVWVVGGNALASLLLFARNVLLARMLPVEDYGIAITFVLIVAGMELASTLAVDRFLVQDAEGAEPRLQATMQMVDVTRGAGLALLLFLLAPQVAALFHAPVAEPAFRLLALVPLIRGLRHLDIIRFQRHGDFGGMIRAPLIAQMLATGALVPLLWWIGDHRAMLWSVLIQHAAFAGLTHVLAVRRYTLAADRGVIGRALRFGWPLMLNGALMFMVMNGDRLIVGGLFGPAELGLFSAAATLALTPTLILGKSLQTLALPMLAQRHRSGTAGEGAIRATVELSLLAGAGFATAMAILGPWLFVTIFGAKFAGAADLLVLLCVAQGLRLGRAGPAIVAVAAGQTARPLIANLLRVAALPPALVAAWSGASLTGIVLVAIAGECLATVVALRLLDRRSGGAVGRLVLPVSAVCALLGLIVLRTLHAPSVTYGGAALLIALLLVALTMRGLRGRVIRAVRGAA